jgi:DNA helicase HerA-like ATPase
MDAGVENLIRYGRHQDVELIGISRRPAEVNRDLTANANEIYIFRTHEPRDIAYFREILGSDVADSLPSLPKFTPYVWSDDVQEKHKSRRKVE